MPAISGNASGTGVISARATAQFDKTNSSVLSDVTGLSVTLSPGLTYHIEIYLPMSAPTGANGGKIALAGTATATYALVNVYIIYLDDPGIPQQFLTYLQQATSISLTADFGTFNGATKATARLEGTVVVNGGGTLKIQFAQSIPASGQTSSVLRGATIIATPV